MTHLLIMKMVFTLSNFLLKKRKKKQKPYLLDTKMGDKVRNACLAGNSLEALRYASVTEPTPLLFVLVAVLGSEMQALRLRWQSSK
jgi:hypothetical protein